MKPFFLKLTGALALAGVIISCSDGGSGFAGIGGSGFISTGTVTGFGSVFVNGVEFQTNSTTSFDVEDNVNATQSDLRIGMVVQVNGSINSDRVTGTATAIRYGDQLEGPVSGTLSSPNAIETNPDGTQKSFRVLGTNVIVDSVDTVFKGTGFSFSSITLDNVVEISGHYDQNDVLRATYIELKAATYNPASTVEIEGTISALSGTSFIIRNVNVNASAANLSDLPNGLQNGIYVEVKGTYNSSSNTITASRVEAEDIELKDDGSDISIEGYITRYVSNSDFDINGKRINASNAVFEPGTLQLRSGIKVEAEGSISNSILNATNVEIRGGDAEVHATISTIDTTAGTFTLDVLSGQTAITVSLTSATSLEDEVLETEPFLLTNMNTGDFVEVVGFETGNSAITATKVKRVNTSDTILQAYATVASGNATAGDITLLGITFNFDSATNFEDESDSSMTTDQINALIISINSTPRLVKVKDEIGVTVGTAEEIDLEN